MTTFYFEKSRVFANDNLDIVDNTRIPNIEQILCGMIRARFSSRFYIFSKYLNSKSIKYELDHRPGSISRHRSSIIEPMFHLLVGEKVRM